MSETPEALGDGPAKSLRPLRLAERITPNGEVPRGSRLRMARKARP